MIDHIEIDGKKVPYLLSYRALKNITKVQGSEGITVESVEHALYWALYSGHYKQTPDKEFPYKFDQMEVLLDDFELFLKVQKDIKNLTNKISPETGNVPAPAK